MRVHIAPSRVCGLVHVPGSKSYTIRAAVCAAIADGESVISGAQISDDATAAFQCLRQLGPGIGDVDDLIHVEGGDLHAPREALWCGESGATFRFLAALAATVPGETTLRCAPSLARRPMAPLVDAILQLSVPCRFDAATGTLVVYGRRQSSGLVTLRADVSSQFLSAMLMSGPRYEAGLRVKLSTPVVSERYVEMTKACMCAFGADVGALQNNDEFVVSAGGLVPARYSVEGDWSGAAALLALGALVGDVRVATLWETSLQADVKILSLLERMGAGVNVVDGIVGVTQAPLDACDFQLSDAIDLLPVACALAATARGVTKLSGIARARDKESDRVTAMADGLTRLGVDVEVGEDEMRIRGGVARGGSVSSAGDHRIAMAFGILGAAVGDITVDGAECVSKTYPGFWNVLTGLGVKVTSDE